MRQIAVSVGDGELEEKLACLTIYNFHHLTAHTLLSAMSTPLHPLLSHPISPVCIALSLSYYNVTPQRDPYSLEVNVRKC